MDQRRSVLISLIVMGGLTVYLASLSNYLPPLPSTIPPRSEWPPSPHEAGTTRTDARGIVQVWVPAGWFRYGSDFGRDHSAEWAETPQHDVHLTHGFWIDVDEVSNAAYDRFVADRGYLRQELWSESGWKWKGSRVGPDRVQPEFDAPDQPRVAISWYEADAYARWRDGRLPTEAEWEYAARGPEAVRYPWGEEWEDGRANSQESGVNHTVAIDQYASGKSWCGAVQMAGNVWEWVADWYDEKIYRQAVRDDPQGPATGSLRCARGGSWASPRASTRSARRSSPPPDHRSVTLGLRIASAEG